MAQNQSQNQQNSQRAAAIAAKALQNPSSLNDDEIKTLAASVQNQSGQQFSQNQQNQQDSQNQQGQQRR